MDYIIGVVLDNAAWPVISTVGGWMFSRLWFGYVCRKLTKGTDLSWINEAFGGLAYRELKPENFKTYKLIVPRLGDFNGYALKAAAHLCWWTFWKPADRRALSTFITLLKKFDEQPTGDGLLGIGAAQKYSQYVKYHLWCHNFMENIGFLGTNNFNYDGSHISEALPFEYGIELDKHKAFENYCKKKGVKFVDLNDLSNLPQELKNTLDKKI